VLLPALQQKDIKKSTGLNLNSLQKKGTAQKPVRTVPKSIFS
jgi:hypothetical protein